MSKNFLVQINKTVSIDCFHEIEINGKLFFQQSQFFSSNF
ncbi:hypothetical protein G436_1142 [Leptospira interrogans serovar Hardjo str. Norma]|uniref:Uncharacterized protein n=1 Tax=Leptospira interrogans serovar Hardjo str. Norma TaxID=1279460 RepID=A0A0M5L8L4_LEPIR|nr:hypothetical protein G436_1142 [Leptospira interrogans serovar Hardjo str. Norma]